MSGNLVLLFLRVPIVNAWIVSRCCRETNAWRFARLNATNPDFDAIGNRLQGTGRSPNGFMDFILNSTNSSGRVIPRSEDSRAPAGCPSVSSFAKRTGFVIMRGLNAALLRSTLYLRFYVRRYLGTLARSECQSGGDAPSRGIVETAGRQRRLVYHESTMTHLAPVLISAILLSQAAAWAQTRNTDNDVTLLKRGEKAYSLVFPTAASGAPTSEDLKLESTGNRSSEVQIERYGSRGALIDSIVKTVAAGTSTNVRLDNPNGFITITVRHGDPVTVSGTIEWLKENKLGQLPMAFFKRTLKAPNGVHLITGQGAVALYFLNLSHHPVNAKWCQGTHCISDRVSPNALVVVNWRGKGDVDLRTEPCTYFAGPIFGDKGVDKTFDSNSSISCEPIKE